MKVNLSMALPFFYAITSKIREAYFISLMSRKEKLGWKTFRKVFYGEAAIYDDVYYPSHQATGFYHRWKEDIVLFAEMRFKAYQGTVFRLYYVGMHRFGVIIQWRDEKEML